MNASYLAASELTASTVSDRGSRHTALCIVWLTNRHNPCGTKCPDCTLHILTCREEHHTPSVYEARCLLKDMLLDTHTQCVIATQDQLREIEHQIKERTRHLHHEYCLESTNLRTLLSALINLNRMSGTIFVTLRIPGEVSTFDIAKVINGTANGSVRLMLVYSPMLVATLHATGMCAVPL